MDNKEFVLESMRNIGIQAVEKLQSEAPTLDGTASIDRENYIPDFADKDGKPAKQYLNWGAGTAVRDNGQVWQLIQPYDSTVFTERPEDLRAQWGLCHTKNPLKAKAFVTPYGISGLYMKGECCLVDGVVYISKNENNNFHPNDYPDGWEVYNEE